MESVFILSSIGMLAAKLVILLRCSLRDASPWLLTYFGAFFWMGLVEASGFAYFNKHPEEGYSLFISYYVAIITASFSALLLSLELAEKLSVATLKLFILLWMFVCLMVATPGLVIKDVVSIGYSYTRVPGPLYVVAPASVIATFGAALFFSHRSKVVRSDEKAIKQARIFIKSTLILLISCGIVAGAMAANFKINGVLIISFATLVSMAYLFWQGRTVSLFGIEKRKLSILGDSDDPLENEETLPNLETITNQKVLTLDSLDIKYKEIVSTALRCENGIVESRMLIDYVLIDLALEECEGNKTRAAQKLGRSGSVSSIDRILKEYQKYYKRRHYEINEGKSSTEQPLVEG